MRAPLVSVLTPNYNHGRYLQKCLAGVFYQTFTDFEFLITDDGSTDDSRSIIEEAARKDSRVKPLFFEKNRGVVAAMENLMERAQGKYMYWVAADDFVINKDFFQKGVTALEKDPRPAGFYGITGIYLAEKEKLTGGCGTAEVEGYNTPRQCTEGFLKCRSVASGPGCFWRRDLYSKHGGMELASLYPALGPQLDFYINHALAFMYGLIYEKTPFACQRVFEAKSNISANMHLWKVAAHYAELEKALRKIAITYPDMEADWMRWRAFWMIDTINKSGVKV